MSSGDFKHKPVLLSEVLDTLKCVDGGVYLDCTVGGGGHSSEILLKIGKTGFLFGLDRDIEAITAADQKLKNIGSNYKLIKDSYRNMERIIEENKIPLLDGILFDLGVSSPQLDNTERGFSFSKDAPLDMRFGQDEYDSPTAADLINTLSKEKLTEIFSKYGEEPYSKTIAQAIVDQRKKYPLKTTVQLAELILNSLKGKKFIGKIHPATRVFQALRIEVNQELEGVEKTIPVAMRFLKKGGRLAIITFHSLEDRIVKEVFKNETVSCICPPKQPICTCDKVAQGKLVNKKPIVANDEEIKVNPRARSAKLRVIEKI